MILFLLASCVVLGLKLNQLSDGRLWEISSAPRVVGHLLHSVSLDSSLASLIEILSSRHYPFDKIYTNSCRLEMDLPRLMEILALNPSLHKILINPLCLQYSPIVLTEEHVRSLGYPVLATSRGHLPRMTDDALMCLIEASPMRSSGGCEWVVSLPQSGPWLSLPTFWHFLHQECFLPRRHDAANRNLMHIMFEAGSVEEAMKVGQLHEYLRWTVRALLVTISLHRSFMDDEGAMAWISREFEWHLECIGYYLERPLDDQQRTLLQACRSLSLKVLQRLFYTDYSPPKYPVASMPPFEDLALLMGPDDASNQWKISVMFLYLQLDCNSISGLDERIAKWMVDSESVWPVDLIYMMRLQLEPISCSAIQGKDFLMPHLRKLVQGSAMLQDCLLDWTLKHRGYLNTGYMKPNAKVMIAEIPLVRRLKYIRGIWHESKFFQGAHSRLSKLLPICDAKFQFDPSTSIRGMVRAYFLHWVGRRRILRNPITETLQIVLQNIQRMKVFGIMCVLALIYRVKFPVELDSAQLSMLLGLSSPSELDPRALSLLFPTEACWKEPEPRAKRRAVLQMEFLASRLAGAPSQVQDLLPLGKILASDEVLAQLNIYGM